MRTWQKIALAVGGVLALATVAKQRPDDDDDDDDDDATPSEGPIVKVQPVSVHGTPFAVGDDPTWPLATTHARGHEVPFVDVTGKRHGRFSRRFGADRGDHWHQGIDLFCDVGDAVLAMESGQISGVFKTFHLGTGAVVLVTDSGLTIVYGEIGPGTWASFGIGKGDRVAKGQPLATVQPNSAGTWMLHLETYAGAFSTNDPPKSALLDPTLYLLTALADSEIA